MEGGKEQNYWPGFVDALSNVVLTLIFVLVIFVFALLMASNKVAQKMEEIATAEKSQKTSQQQLDQALSELEKLHAVDLQNRKSTLDDENVSQQAFVRFKKSDSTQTTSPSSNGDTLTINFDANAISITEETAQTIQSFIEKYKATTGVANPKFVIESPEDKNSATPMLSREAQLGRMLNTRNTLLSGKVEARSIAIHSLDNNPSSNQYNWVTIHVEK
jgi:hypothetical protein